MSKIESQEAPFVCFTEFRKKLGDDEYAVIHLTIRDEDDSHGVLRLNELIKSMVASGWQHADSPKAQRGGWGVGKGNKPKKVEIPENGRFEVRALARAHFSDKDNIRVYGVNGEESVDWEGRALKGLLVNQSAIKAIQDAFGGWATWELNQEKPVAFHSNKLIARCEKSQKSGSWYIKEFLVEPKTG